MDENPAYLETVSLHVARVLDEIGLNQLTVKRRRRAFILIEHLQTIVYGWTVGETSIYHFGSQTEGSTTPGLRSDLDQLSCLHEWIAVQDWAEWQPGKINLLMLHEDTAPGYCRLQVLRLDIPSARENLVDGENYVFDNSGRVILKNSCFIQDVGGVRNGPAQSHIGKPGRMYNDFVIAFQCKSWPRHAEEFIRRHRRHTWPTQDLLQQVVQQGCFLVPVGHKLSPTEHLEWRISASLSERCLMFSLNIVHLKVYVLLKMLMKSFVEPRARKSISSYHCKTALLYCVENTDSQLWVERNILQCVLRCLSLLHSWVSECFCPQFIITDENLFAGKVTAQNRCTLLTILRDMILSNGRVLLGVRIDDIGHKLQAHLSIAPSVVPVLDSTTTVLLIGHLEHQKYVFTKHSVKFFCTHAQNTEPIIVIRSVYKNIKKLKDRVRHLNKPKRQANESIIEFLYGWLGSLLASVSLSHNMRVPRVTIQLLCIGSSYDLASMLKLASVFYSNGAYRQVDTILHRVNTHLNRNMIRSECRCYDNPPRPSDELFHMMGVLRGRKARAKLVAQCVTFTRQEIHCAPPALRNEFFRAVGDDIQHRNPKSDQWMDLAAVDCVPYLHYLQYMTYSHLGKHDLQRLTLLNLEQCIREDNGLSHLETAWNLLGQSMELENDLDAAMTCYRASLEIRPRNNAANWHIRHLCYTRIKSGCLPT